MLKDLAKEGVEVANGVNTGYLIIFSICAVAYLIGWFVMKSLVPKYKPIQL
jgi:ACS family hexuronate transporter-like MFS transporter